jgi:hypothetical protein
MMDNFVLNGTRLIVVKKNATGSTKPKITNIFGLSLTDLTIQLWSLDNKTHSTLYLKIGQTLGSPYTRFNHSYKTQRFVVDYLNLSQNRTVDAAMIFLEKAGSLVITGK